MHRRMIDPSFWQSETIAELDVYQRYFFIGLFSNADDQGRLRGHPALLRSLIYKFDDMELDTIQAQLGELSQEAPPEPFIQLYTVGGREYVQILNWWKWQHPKWAYPSKWPAPPEWRDRLKYRRGNSVIKSNWDDDQPRLEMEPEPPEEEPEGEEEPPQGEVTVSPPRDDDETDVRSAHRVRVSNRVRVRGRVRDSNSNTRDPPAGGGSDETKASEEGQFVYIALLGDRLKELGIRSGKAIELAQLYCDQGLESNLTDWADRWIWHYSKDPLIHNPHGMAITALEEFQEPTVFRDDDPRRWTESDYGDVIEH